MRENDLSATAMWDFDLDIVDDDQPFDMTGMECIWVATTKENVEVARAMTAGLSGATGASGTITAITGPSGATGRSRLHVEIPSWGHTGLAVPKDWVMIDANLAIYVNDDWKWLGRREWRVVAGPNFTGATGA